MLAILAVVLLGAGTLKFVVTLCGHYITWRLAIVLALLIALTIALCLIGASR